jgi:hypothetical protein
MMNINDLKNLPNLLNVFKKKYKYPTWICRKCANDIKPNWESTVKEPYVATYHDGICDVCGNKKSVTEPRDFGHFKMKDIIKYINEGFIK